MTTSIPIELHPVEDVSAQSAYDAVISSREALAPWMHWLTPSYSLRDQQAFQSRSAVLRGAGLEFGRRRDHFLRPVCQLQDLPNPQRSSGHSNDFK